MFTRINHHSHYLVLAVIWAIPLAGHGKLEWAQTNIARVAEPGTKAVVAIYQFVNKGDTPVTIREVNTGCDCTVASLEKRLFAAGESGEIAVTFNLEGRTGKVQRELLVATDDAHEAPSRLILDVDILDRLSYSTRLLVWKINGPRDEKTVDLAAMEGNTVEYLEILPIDAPVATATVETLAPGRSYRLHVSPISTDTMRSIPIRCAVTFLGGPREVVSIYALVR